MKIGENARTVLEKRYLAKDEKGQAKETVEGLFRRVADTIAQGDLIYDENADIKSLSDEFYTMMTDLEFLPNSPTLMNAGRPLGQLSACFVLPIPDSMEGIFDAIKNAALIHKSGGGTGFSFSRLRGQGATVNSTGGVASGPISFMKVFNAATDAVKQGGTRRGANMGILKVDHPDIMEFITCKNTITEINNFNISVGVTENFMDSVEKDLPYDLLDPFNGEPVGQLMAKEVFETIVESAWATGEPGIIFLDRLNKDNVVPSLGEIESTNPCGEQPLLPYESCNLGSINLVHHLKENNGLWEVDYEKLEATIEKAVHFLDNVIDINKYPLEEIDRVTKLTRKIGLGVMGFADMLLYLGIPYNSDEGVDFGRQLMKRVNTVGHKASEKLAEKRGAFPTFSESIYKDGKPLRNATVTTIAPTGTLSIIASVSSGVEPVFAYAYYRNVMDNTHLIETNNILERHLKEKGLFKDSIMKSIVEHGSLEGLEEIPEDTKKLYVCAHDVDPIWHVRMQAAFQENTDNAVSKTVNFPKSATREDVAESYKLAYTLGCKGTTIYRDGSRNEQVLNIGESRAHKEAKTLDGHKKAKVSNDSNEVKGPTGSTASKEARGFENPSIDDLETDGLQELKKEAAIVPRPRPNVTMGFTEKVKIGCGNLYITVNYDEKGICEVFTNTGRAGGCPSQSEATARLISIALRSGMDGEVLAEQLRGIRCASTIRQKGLGVTSCPDAIAKTIEKVMEASKTGSNGIATIESTARKVASKEQDKKTAKYCPECGSQLEHEGGCVTCRNCGYSKCG